MASSKEYLDYILDCLSGLDEITARKMMGAKPMLLVENAEDSFFISQLFDALYSELPAPKQRKKKN